MIKTIFVPASGSDTDDSVFETALVVAKALAAHLDFYHVRLTEGEAAVSSPDKDVLPRPSAARRVRAAEQTGRAIGCEREQAFRRVLCRKSNLG